MSRTMGVTETLSIWRCIGCGSMGNAAECTGDCTFKKLAVVGVMEHADALAALECAVEDELKLSELSAAIARAAGENGDPEKTYRALQHEARTLLRSLVSPEAAAPPETEAATVWLCGTCGQIEASVPCIGVCVRRSEEVVRAGDHAAVLAELADRTARLGLLRRLAVRLARVTPKAGQWRASLDAVRKEAQEIATCEEGRTRAMGSAISPVRST